MSDNTETEAAVVVADVAPTLPPATPEPVKLSNEDYLRAENISLKLMNVGEQTLRIQHQMKAELQKCIQARMDLSKQFDDHRAYCLNKYGVDITEVEIGPDGTILGPKKPQAPQA